MAVGRPGEIAIPEPTEEWMSPRRRRGLIPGDAAALTQPR
jgi:hypothetical protein